MRNLKYRKLIFEMNDRETFLAKFYFVFMLPNLAAKQTLY